MRSSVPKELADEVANAQVKLLYRNALIGALVTALTATLLVWLQAQGPLSSAVLPWLIIVLVICALRLALAMAYVRMAKPAQTAWWRNAFMVGVGLAGACWAATVFIFMPEGDLVRETATALVLAGMAAGAEIGRAHV